MKKTSDVLYATFVGLALFLLGAIILGGIRYLISLYIGIDFVSVLLYFFIARYITKQVLKGINYPNKYIMFILPFYTALMYIFKDYIALVIVYVVQGVKFTTMLSLIPQAMLYNLLSYFQFEFSIDGIFSNILSLLYLAIEILVMGAGVYDSYRETKRFY